LQVHELSPNGTPFDLTVTVARLDVANSVLSNNITVAQSSVGFVILIGLQFIIAYSVAHWGPLRGGVNLRPTLLLHCGKFVHDAMRRQRVAGAEVRARDAAPGIDRD
jgi:uncharacterized membrane protein YcaP (DUF421 family)